MPGETTGKRSFPDEQEDVTFCADRRKRFATRLLPCPEQAPRNAPFPTEHATPHVQQPWKATAHEDPAFWTRGAGSGGKGHTPCETSVKTGMPPDRRKKRVLQPFDANAVAGITLATKMRPENPNADAAAGPDLLYCFLGSLVRSSTFSLAWRTYTLRTPATSPRPLRLVST